MKQVLQSLKTGATEIAEVPCPAVSPRHLLTRSTRTLLSVGTERMLIEFGKAGWIEKARQQPDKVAMVIDKVRTDGLIATVESVLNKLDQPLPLGYCNVGVVLDVGPGVTGVSKGDRIASNGKHAEVVSVPITLCAKVPDAVSDDEAAFTVLGAIALQGIRLVKPTLGETVVVTGLGLIGLMAVQLLRAHGCRVLGIDFDSGRLALARQLGAETVDLGAGQDPVATAQAYSRSRGVDAVLITASTTSHEPVHQAATMCRKRGRIVLVGTTGLKLSRADFYEKELSFQVSCSYGPGRYDASYEEKGHDYPVGFVRWTEQRNFEAVLDMMADGRLDVKPLITHRFAIADARKAYELLSADAASLGILLEYPAAAEKPDDLLRQPSVKLVQRPHATTAVPTGSSVAFIGAGNYATSVLIPAFKRAGARLKVVASVNGVSGVHAARKFAFEETSTDPQSIFADPDVHSVVVATRHDTHARLVCDALASGKHVFAEKPLALTMDELAHIEQAYERANPEVAGASGSGPLLMVGFNRRFAPHVVKMHTLLQGAAGPKAAVMTVNAGAIPVEHWTQDPARGGGRIIGEACHFIDLMRYVVGAPIVSHSSTRMDASTGDTVTIELAFADGSIGTIHYFANGTKSFAKERLEVFSSGRIMQLDNFRRLTGYGWPGFRKMSLWRQDKGQSACARAFIRAVEHGAPSPIPFPELIEVSRVTIEIAQSLR